MSMEELQLVTDMLMTVGMWIIGFILFFQERRSHDDTRRLHMADLREVAGMTPRLQRPSSDDDKLIAPGD